VRAAARTLATRLVERFGAACDGAETGLTRYFPEAAHIAGAKEKELTGIGLTAARARTLRAVAVSFEDGALSLSRGATHPEAICTALERIPGVGPWTAQYFSMRGLSWPDAFPAGDLGIRKALGGIEAAACRKLAERWRPWRAYAAMQLWASL
jgi:AraC family transcriptional regulator, regulatory protein of adaptative response / DNA-3-methyladenine glycosylase II